MNKTDLLLTPVHEYFNADTRKLWKQVLYFRGLSCTNEKLQIIESINLSTLYAIAVLHHQFTDIDLTTEEADAAMYALRTQPGFGHDDPYLDSRTYRESQ